MVDTFPLAAIVSVLISSVCVSGAASRLAANLSSDPQNGFLSTNGNPTIN